MPTPISQLVPMPTLAIADLLRVVDVSDTSMASTGTDKHATIGQVQVSAGIYNARAYGALGNGIADDTAAIQAAIDAASAGGGGVVYLPPGVYMTSAPLLLKVLCSLVGAGMGLGPGVSTGKAASTVALLPGANCNVINVQPVSWATPSSHASATCASRETGPPTRPAATGSISWILRVRQCRTLHRRWLSRRRHPYRGQPLQLFPACPIPEQRGGRLPHQQRDHRRNIVGHGQPHRSADVHGFL